MAKKTKTQEQREALYLQVCKDLLPWSAPTLPSLANVTPQALIDDVGRMKAMISDLETAVKTMNNVIDMKLEAEPLAITDGGDGSTIRGEEYEMKLIPVSQTKLDSTLAREKLFTYGGQEAINECSKVINMVQHRYSEI